MAAFSLLCLVALLLASSATACDRCVHQSKATFLLGLQALQHGACGYGSQVIEFNHARLAAAIPSIYKEGAGCGACFQIRCKDENICKREGTTVLVTDRNGDNRTDFVLSGFALLAMAKEGKARDLRNRGIVDVEYKRVPCDYEDRNLTVRVEEFSQKPYYLAIKLLYQGGQTEVVAIAVAQVGSSDWSYMRRNYGAVWDTNKVPDGPLQFQFVVTAGYDGKWYWAKSVLPANWKNSSTYDMGIQITDIAQESCYPCDDGTWKIQN